MSLQVLNLWIVAIDTHKWYKAKFEDYPLSRKAIIPFVYWLSFALSLEHIIFAFQIVSWVSWIMFIEISEDINWTVFLMV